MTDVEFKSAPVFLVPILALGISNTDRVARFSSTNLRPGRNCPMPLRIIDRWLLPRPTKSDDIHPGARNSSVGEGDIADAFLENNNIDHPRYEASAIKGTQRQMNYPKTEKGGKKIGKDHRVSCVIQMIISLGIAKYVGRNPPPSIIVNVHMMG